MKTKFQTAKQSFNETIAQLTPCLSKAVVARGEARGDDFNLHEMYRTQAPGVLYWLDNYEHYLTIGCLIQFQDICRAKYLFYEAISLILEQSDHWVDDADKLVQLAIDYLDGKFDNHTIKFNNCEVRGAECGTSVSA